MDEASGVRVELGNDHLATVWIDSPAASVNTLSSHTWDGLDAAVRKLEASGPVGVVIASAKPRSFIAGADLFELEAMTDAALEAHLARGQAILDRLAALPMPTAAAINGDTLGGGLEVALACRYRVAVDDPRIKIGLPETTLGLVPGWGGTFRLPRLVGIEQALLLLVSGEAITSVEARTLGLVDALADRESLLDVARHQVLSSPARPVPVVEPLDRIREVCNHFRQTTRDRSGDHLPAPLRVIDLVETGYLKGHDAALAAERTGLVAMRASAAGKQLLRMFFVRTAAKKKAVAEAGGTPRAVKSVVVIGGGTMGAGIAAALAANAVSAWVIEVDDVSARAATTRLAGIPGGSDVAVTADWGAVTTADLVVEAALENLAVKKDIFRKLGELARPDAVLASNTSSLGVASLAAVASHPSRVIGLHFFNPVARMALVEVVRGVDSEPDAVATGVAVATMLGKTPVVCRDAPGFVVNRVLFPYLRAAIELVDDGADIAALDAAARRWGMPTGPCALLDEIGLDVSLSIFASLASALGERYVASPTLAAAVARGWLGKKSGQGFYAYRPNHRPAPNAAWANLAPTAPSTEAIIDDTRIESRLIAPMVAEARLVLEEGIVSSPDSLDLTSILGMGFPAFRGGLGTYAMTGSRVGPPG